MGVAAAMRSDSSLRAWNAAQELTRVEPEPEPQAEQLPDLVDEMEDSVEAA
jgi:hypothetical protein